MDFQIKERYDINDLLKIIEMLRDPEKGCPWDKVQTHLSISKNFIEETYEVIEAIDNDDKVLMQEELGDVLMQVLLHAQFEAEQNVFDFGDVVNGTAQKLVLRHPHIFAGFDNKTVDGVLQKWEEIKQQEKGQKTVTETLDAVPKSLPALIYAQKLQKRAKTGGLIEQNPQQAVEALQASLDEVKAAIGEEKNLSALVGKLLFSAVNLAGATKNDAEEVLGFENAKMLAEYKKLDVK
ncbi:MAG: nucleoside triphosphate pyrophosphohydrolase [Oscillospiraceae bacterium]|nr:nucleoside triphosphate pyrophosphohydrolase [Oscillospiraceae bacterium]